MTENGPKPASITVEYVGGEFGFVIRWSVTESWADFTVVAVESIESQPNGDRPIFDRIGGGQTFDPSEAQHYLKGYIKWDGCSELQFGSDDYPSLHFCGPTHFRKHFALLKHLYLRASELMGRGKDGLDEPWDEEQVAVNTNGASPEITA